MGYIYNVNMVLELNFLLIIQRSKKTPWPKDQGVLNSRSFR